MIIAICDDEKIFRQEVVHYIMLYLEQYQKDYRVKSFQSGEELLNYSEELSLVFLDYEMQGMNGMETARRLREKNRDTVIAFLTSHTEVMQEAFIVKAFRYLLKPVTYEAIEECINAAGEELEQEKE